MREFPVGQPLVSQGIREVLLSRQDVYRSRAVKLGDLCIGLEDTTGPCHSIVQVKIGSTRTGDSSEHAWDGGKGEEDALGENYGCCLGWCC